MFGLRQHRDRTNNNTCIGGSVFQYDEEDQDIILCVNCDAEYTITKIDDEQQEPEFCPFCGFQHIEDEEEDDDIEDESEDGPYLN
jgi:uncharacterized paraquat-inducible protein A